MKIAKKISLIICTRNRAGAISRCLNALLKLESTQNFELIVVNNASTDNTAHVLQKFADTSSFPVVIVDEPTPGLSRARNAGIAAADGDLIAFSDDDCYLAPNYLTALRQTFLDNAIGFIGGRVLLFDTADLPITIQTSEKFIKFHPCQYMPPSGAIHGANFAFRREVFDKVGVFDVALGAGTPCMGAEDTDMLQRALIAGFHGLYSPEPVVFHHHGRQNNNDEEFILCAYAVCRGAYFLKGMCNKKTRWIYIKPVLKRFVGHFVYARFATLRNEFQGAVCYWKQLHPGNRA